jgi:predicted secreted protein
VTRADVLAGLQRELRHAEANGAAGYAARLRAQIAGYSQGSAADPAIETTGRPAARRRTASGHRAGR